MAKNLPDPSRRSFITRLTNSFLEMARELITLAEEWQGRSETVTEPPVALQQQSAQEREVAIQALLRLPVSHLIYLLTFDPPRPVEKPIPLPSYLVATDWGTLLEETPSVVADHLQSLGALVRADLPTHIAVRDFKHAELQAMLRARQLPVSGNKEELIDRLCQADEVGMWVAVGELILLEYTFWAGYTAKTRLEEVLATQPADAHQQTEADPTREAIKWILAAAVGGVVGNRADDVLMALVDSIRAQSVHADNTPSPNITSPLPTPQPDTPAPEPQPEPQQQSTSRPRSTPIPKLTFDWVTIPAGEFWMGSDKRKDPLAYDDETPQHKVYLPTYRIARVPVTNAYYKQFVDAKGYQSPSHWPNGQIPIGKENHPVVNVSWHDAIAFCKWARVLLPNEAEWEKAARGTDGRIYPWGNETPDWERCNFVATRVLDTTTVGNYSRGKSFYGVLDMAGNIWEWTHSLYKDYPYRLDDGREDPAMVRDRVLRGGSFEEIHDYPMRCAYRYRWDPHYRDYAFGFRVLLPGS